MLTDARIAANMGLLLRPIRRPDKAIETRQSPLEAHQAQPPGAHLDKDHV
jgi:hypothetical protein